MEILYTLIIGEFIVLAAVCVWFYLDAEGKQKLLEAMRTELKHASAHAAAAATNAAEAVAKAQRQGEHIELLARSVAALATAAQPRVADETGRPAVEIPRVRVEEDEDRDVPPDSEGRGLSLEKMAKLHGERLEDVDAFADAEGLSREEAIKQAVLNGLESIEAYAVEHQLTREEAMKIFLAESQSRYPTPTPTDPITAVEHCHGPLCVDDGSACMCSCPRCEPAPR